MVSAAATGDDVTPSPVAHSRHGVFAMNRLLFVGLASFLVIVGLALSDGGTQRATAQSGCLGYTACNGCYGSVTYARCCGGYADTSWHWNYPVRRFLYHAFYPLHQTHSACYGCYGSCGGYARCYGGTGCQGCYGYRSCIGCEGCAGSYRVSTCACSGCDGTYPHASTTTTYRVVAEAIEDDTASEIHAEPVEPETHREARSNGPTE